MVWFGFTNRFQANLTTTYSVVKNERKLIEKSEMMKTKMYAKYQYPYITVLSAGFFESLVILLRSAKHFHYRVSIATQMVKPQSEIKLFLHKLVET